MGGKAIHGSTNSGPTTNGLTTYQPKSKKNMVTYFNTFAKLGLGAPNGNAKHQLGLSIGGSLPKLQVSHDIGEGIATY